MQLEYEKNHSFNSYKVSALLFVQSGAKNLLLSFSGVNKKYFSDTSGQKIRYVYNLKSVHRTQLQKHPAVLFN